MSSVPQTLSANSPRAESPKLLMSVEAELVEQRQEDVRHRRAVGRLEVQVAVEHAVAVTEQQQRAAAMVVDVAVAPSASRR